MTYDERINKTIEIAARLMAGRLASGSISILDMKGCKDPYIRDSIEIARSIISEAEKEAK